MKTLKKQFKSIALILSMLILLQGCTVYKSANITLEEASKTWNKIKIKTNTNETLKYKRVEVQNGKYFGIKKENRLINMVEIDTTNIKTIRTQDKALSTVLGIGVPAVIVGIGGLIWIKNNAFTGFGSGYGAGL